jgi:hypothetical protein
MQRQRGRTIGTAITLLFAAAAMIAFLSGRSAEWRPAPVATEKATRPELRPGASVFASDGTQVGKVEWVSVDYPTRIARIRFAQPRSLGIGERVLTVKGDVFTVRDGNVYLILSPAEVAALPEALPFDDAASMLPKLNNLR